MNRGLALALILLGIAVSIVLVDTHYVKKEISESYVLLSALPAATVCEDEDAERLFEAYKRSRTLLAISVAEGYLNEYEEALAALSASVASKEVGNYAAAREEALAALRQIKRSALFSFGQIF